MTIRQTYFVETFDGQLLAKCTTLEEAREAARRWLGVEQLSPDLQGGCPDPNHDDSIAGVESWQAAVTDNQHADAEAAVYILRAIP